MQSIGGLLSNNQVVVALANLGGVIGLFMLLVAALKWTQQFVRSVWEGNVKSALRLMHFRIAKRIIWCARDMHVFVAEIMQRLLSAALGIVSPIVLMLSYTSTEAAQFRLFGIPEGWQAANDRALMVFGTFFFLVAIFSIGSLSGFMKQVRRRRIRMLKRQLD